MPSFFFNIISPYEQKCQIILTKFGILFSYTRYKIILYVSD